MSIDDPDIPDFPHPAPRHFTLPPKPRSSPLGLTIGIAIIVILLVGGGIAIKMLIDRQGTLQTPAPVIAKAPPNPAAPTESPRGSTDLKVSKPAPSSNAPASSDPSPDPSPVASADPTTPDWERVQQAYRTATPELAIVALQDFVQSASTSTFASTARSQIDECLDRLWWVRVKQLCDQRDDLKKRISEIDQQIAVVKRNGAVPERIAELQSDRKPIETDLTRVTDGLSEMKYTDARTPDPYDDAQLAELRKTRVPAAFDAWKKSTAAHIKRSRGKLPW